MLTVPVDEGEAEAQPDMPLLTITLLHEGGQQAAFPWLVGFSSPCVGSFAKRALASWLRENAARWAEGMGYRLEPFTDPKITYEEGVPHVSIAAILPGYVEGDPRAE